MDAVDPRRQGQGSVSCCCAFVANEVRRQRGRMLLSVPVESDVWATTSLLSPERYEEISRIKDFDRIAPLRSCLPAAMT